MGELVRCPDCDPKAEAAPEKKDFHHKGDEGGDTGSHHWFPNLFHRGD